MRLARERIKGCEDCNERGCKYGLPAEGMLRWCSVCAHKSHPCPGPLGAVKRPSRFP